MQSISEYRDKSSYFLKAIGNFIYRIQNKIEIFML